MTKGDQKRISGDGLDFLLDAALKKQAAVEPRAGLEDRVLANLRGAQAQIPVHSWWKWGLAASVAIIIAAVALAFRPERKSQPLVAIQTPTTRQNPHNTETKVAIGEVRAVPRRPAIRSAHTARATAMASAALPGPKLDQFPSPRPLTDEEKMLLGYIEQNPDRAALLAEARMDSLRRDAEERHRIENESQRTAQ